MRGQVGPTRTRFDFHDSATKFPVKQATWTRLPRVIAGYDDPILFYRYLGIEILFYEIGPRPTRTDKNERGCVYYTYREKSGSETSIFVHFILCSTAAGYLWEFFPKFVLCTLYIQSASRVKISLETNGMKVTTKGHSKNVSCDQDAMHAESESMNRENVTSHLHDSTNKKSNVLTSVSELPFYRKYLKFLRKFLLSDTRAHVKRTTFRWASCQDQKLYTSTTPRHLYIWSDVKNLSTNMDYFCYRKSFLNRYAMVIRRII